MDVSIVRLNRFKLLANIDSPRTGVVSQGRIDSYPLRVLYISTAKLLRRIELIPDNRTRFERQIILDFFICENKYDSLRYHMGLLNLTGYVISCMFEKKQIADTDTLQKLDTYSFCPEERTKYSERLAEVLKR